MSFTRPEAEPHVIKVSKKPVELLGLNSSRRQAMIFNDAPHTLFVFFKKPSKEQDNWTVKILPGGYYELPILAGTPPAVFPGWVYGLWSGDSKGSCRVTEIT